jgi:hypothetical protein
LLSQTLRGPKIAEMASIPILLLLFLTDIVSSIAKTKQSSMEACKNDAIVSGVSFDREEGHGGSSALRFHVPEPEVRPGGAPDFSNVVIPEAGSVERRRSMPILNRSAASPFPSSACSIGRARPWDPGPDR